MSGGSPEPGLPARRRLVAAFAAAGIGSVLSPARAASDIARWPAGLPAPPLVAQDLDGKTWRLADLRGTAVLVNFWASWCEPCRTEMPTLQQLAEFHGEDRLRVITVNFKESANQITRYMRRAGIRLPVLLDPEGTITRAWEVKVFPTTLLIGYDGAPRHRIRGEIDWSGTDADRLVSALMKPG